MGAIRIAMMAVWLLPLGVGAAAQPADAEPGTSASKPSASPDAAAPETTSPDASAPDAAAPDAATPETTSPDAATPETTPPDASARLPGARGGPQDPRARGRRRPGASSANRLVRVQAALAELKTHGFAVHELRQTANPLQGTVLTATLRGTHHEALMLVLDQLGQESYRVLLRARGPDTYEIQVLPAREGDRGLALFGVRHFRVTGTFRRGETPEDLEKRVDLRHGMLLPMQVIESLRTLGYRATLKPVGPDRVELALTPGRSIRRVRVHGHIPLSAREIQRVLSADARPGALAPGLCVAPKALRRGQRPPVCAPGDVLCTAWRAEEEERLDRYLFDQGFLRGRARLALACGREDSEADLHVFMAKGPGFRLGRVTITGNLGTTDQRWVRRIFRPTVSPILPLPKRLTRRHVEQAKAKVEQEYATPGTRAASRSRRALTLPYPGIVVETSFDRLTPSEVPKRGRKLPLAVDVQLGKGVDTAFLGEQRISENRLRKQLQLFIRRKPANEATARREAANLRAYYQSRGFMLATVEGRFEDFGGLDKLSFRMVEGPRVRIRNIDIPASPHVPPPLLAEIRREYARGRTLRTGRAFTEAGAQEDLGVLLAAYNKRGYLCARAGIRVAFWPQGLTQPQAHARFDLNTSVEDLGTPEWLQASDGSTAGFTPEALAALRGQRRAGLYVVIEVTPGPRVLTSNREILRHLEVPIPTSREVESLPQVHRGWDANAMLEGGPLRRAGDPRVGGVPVNLTTDRDTEQDILARYHAAGYPLADVELRWVYRDRFGRSHSVEGAERLAQPEVGLCREQAAATATTVAPEISVYEGRHGQFGTTLMRGNFKTRYRRANGKPAALAREIRWEEGAPYNRNLVERTRAGIEGMGVTDGVQIREQPHNCELDSDPAKPCVVHQQVTISEAKDRAVDLSWGAGGATLDPFYVFVRPSFPNMAGTAWDLSLEGHVGTNLAALRRVICDGEDCYERSGGLTLTRRRIGASPLTFEGQSQIQRRVTPARGQIDSVLGQVNLIWPINRHWQVSAGYLIQAANISKDLVKPTLAAGCGIAGAASCRPPNRGQAIVPDRTAALRTSVRWERVDNAFNPNKGFIATSDALFASPCLGGQDWWLQVNFGWEHFVPIPRTADRLNFRYSLRYGHAVALPLPRRCGGTSHSRTTSVPEVWRYFGGGTQDLGIRGIAPQTMLVDVEQIRGPFGVATLRPTAVGGTIRALGTLALQVVSAQKFIGGKLAHSVFFDFGVLTQRWRQVDFNRDFRRSVGVNFLKWDIRIVSVSLGYAVLVPNRIWPGNVRPTDDQNGRFVFDVGATF